MPTPGLSCPPPYMEPLPLVSAEILSGRVTQRVGFRPPASVAFAPARSGEGCDGPPASP